MFIHQQLACIGIDPWPYINVYICLIYPLVNVFQTTVKNHHTITGYITYFDWAIFKFAMCNKLPEAIHIYIYTYTLIYIYIHIIFHEVDSYIKFPLNPIKSPFVIPLKIPSDVNLKLHPWAPVSLRSLWLMSNLQARWQVGGWQVATRLPKPKLATYPPMNIYEYLWIFMNILELRFFRLLRWTKCTWIKDRWSLKLEIA